MWILLEMCKEQLNCVKPKNYECPCEDNSNDTKNTKDYQSCHTCDIFFFWIIFLIHMKKKVTIRLIEFFSNNGIGQREEYNKYPSFLFYSSHHLIVNKDSIITIPISASHFLRFIIFFWPSLMQIEKNTQCYKSFKPLHML